MTGLNGGQCDGHARGGAVNLDKPDPEGAIPLNVPRVCLSLSVFVLKSATKSCCLRGRGVKLAPSNQAVLPKEGHMGNVG